MSVLVTIQLMTALAIANLVSRKDAAPSVLVAPLDGMVGKILCLSDMPLIGQVSLLQQDTHSMVYEGTPQILLFHVFQSSQSALKSQSHPIF